MKQNKLTVTILGFEGKLS